MSGTRKRRSKPRTHYQQQHQGHQGTPQPERRARELIDQRQADEIATKAAKTAVKEVFYMLGINVNNAADVERFREDLRLASKLRTVADRVVMLALTSGAAAIGIAAWYAIANHLHPGPRQ